jgi:hypothetical protein
LDAADALPACLAFRPRLAGFSIVAGAPSIGPAAFAA